MHASCESPWHSLAKRTRLGGLLPPQAAFQEYAAHPPRWPGELSSKGSSDTCISDGVSTFLYRAFTAHDKLLAELRCGSSELFDPQVAVRVGHILAARLLATGTLSRRGMETQLSLRVVETETTRLRAAVTDALGSSLECERVVERLAATL